MSLMGKRVVVTRAPHQAGSLMAALSERGAVPIEYPTIDIVLPEDMSVLQDALENLPRYDWAVMTSPNTARMLRNFAVEWDAVQVAAVGATTAEAVHKFLGVDIAFMPEIQLGAELAAQMPITAGQRVFLPQSALADDTVAEILRERGAQVDILTAYENVVGSRGVDLQRMLDANDVDAFTFTSGSTVANLTTRLGHTPTSIPAACIGSATAQVAEEHGYQTVIVPENDYSIRGMLEALTTYFENTTS